MSEQPIVEKTKWHEEAPGQTSSTRIKSALCLVASFGFLLMAVLMKLTGELLQLVGLFAAGYLVAAFAPQAVHKFIEQKFPGGVPK